MVVFTQPYYHIYGFMADLVIGSVIDGVGNWRTWRGFAVLSTISSASSTSMPNTPIQRPTG